MNYLAIFIGGGLGSLLRFATVHLFRKVSYFDFPWGTFISNIIASFLVGLFVGYFISKNIENEWLRNFLLIGLCGGFSTFSTFALENYKFIESNQYSQLVFYILASIIISVLFIFLGLQVFNKA